MTSVFGPNQRKGTKKGKNLTGDSAPAPAAVAYAASLRSSIMTAVTASIIISECLGEKPKAEQISYLSAVYTQNVSS